MVCSPNHAKSGVTFDMARVVLEIFPTLDERGFFVDASRLKAGVAWVTFSPVQRTVADEVV